MGKQSATCTEQIKSGFAEKTPSRLFTLPAALITDTLVEWICCGMISLDGFNPVTLANCC